MAIEHRSFPPGAELPPYFEDSNKAREVAYWAVATQRQIMRWEPLVAKWIWQLTYKQPQEPGIYWQASAERHFALIAAHHLIDAIDFASFPVTVPAIAHDELCENRDLLEHWADNMPVFNSHPRDVKPPRRSGQSFARRNERAGPYDGSAWDNTVGPKLTPNVPATTVRSLIDDVKAVVAVTYPNLAPYFEDWGAPLRRDTNDHFELWMPLEP